MKLKVLGSSSKGNGYALQSSTGECLLLEAGLPFTEGLRAVGYNRKNIAGLCASHVHLDHVKYVKDYLREGIAVFGNDSLAENHEGVTALPEKQWTRIGSFNVLPFSVQHDVPNYGYLIRHPEIGVLFFATDCNYIPSAFRGINHFLIEANYTEDRLLLSDINSSQKRRIMQSHTSLEYAIDYLHQCRVLESDVREIVLIHLSSRHSTKDLFIKRVQKEFGVPTYVAEKNFQLTLK